MTTLVTLPHAWGHLVGSGQSLEVACLTELNSPVRFPKGHTEVPDAGVIGLLMRGCLWPPAAPAPDLPGHAPSHRTPGLSPGVVLFSVAISMPTFASLHSRSGGELALPLIFACFGQAEREASRHSGYLTYCAVFLARAFASALPAFLLLSTSQPSPHQPGARRSCCVYREKLLVRVVADNC